MNSIPSTQGPDDKQKGGEELSTLVPHAPPSPAEPVDSRKGCQQHIPWWKIGIDILTLLALIGAFVSAAYYAYVAHESMLVEERPWIAIEYFEGHIRQPDEFFWAIPSFANVGKSPALNFVAKVNYKIFPKDHKLTVNDIDYRPEQEDETEFNTYRTGAFNPLPGPWQPRFYFHESIDEQTWKDLMQGDKRFWVFSEVTYNDVFGRSLETHFCGYYRPKLIPPLVGCDIYTDTSAEK